MIKLRRDKSTVPVQEASVQEVTTVVGEADVAVEHQGPEVSGRLEVFDDFKNDIEVILQHANLQSDMHYRLIRMDATNVASKKGKGYMFVLKGDPEVKGTILDKDHIGSDGIAMIGSLGLARTTKVNYERRQRHKRELTNLRLQSIKSQYLKAGENIKRGLGKDHKGIKFIATEE